MKVLLAIDASEASQKVIDEVLTRPWPKETSFCVLHVVDLSGTYRVPAMIELDKRAGGRPVRKAAERIGRTGHETSSDVLLGPPRAPSRNMPRNRRRTSSWSARTGRECSRGCFSAVWRGRGAAAHCSVEIVRPSRSHGAEAAPAMKYCWRQTDRLPRRWPLNPWRSVLAGRNGSQSDQRRPASDA